MQTLNGNLLLDHLPNQLMTYGHLEQVINHLLTTFPDNLTKEDNHDWVRLAGNTIRQLSLQRSTGDPLQPEYILSDIMIVKRTATPNALSRAKRQRRRINPPRQIETYMILFLAHYFAGGITALQLPAHIQHLLAFARRVNTPHTTFKTYQILALLYEDLDQLNTAEHFGLLAFNHFRRQNNELETAISAHILGATYNHLGNPTQARYFFEIAHAYYDDNAHHYPQQLGYLNAVIKNLSQS